MVAWMDVDILSHQEIKGPRSLEYCQAVQLQINLFISEVNYNAYKLVHAMCLKHNFLGKVHLCCLFENTFLTHYLIFEVRHSK